MVAAFMVSFANAALPVVTFQNQNPADINITNIQVNTLYINYSVANVENESLVTLYYKSNSTTDNTMFYLNGVSYYGFFSGDTRRSNVTDNFTWRLLDNEVYPGTYNFGPVTIDNIAHTGTLMNSKNDYVRTEYYNFSADKQWGAFEIMANSTPTALASSAYYCNSSFDLGDVLTSPFCALIATRAATTTFDHCHLNQSCHNFFQFAINTTSKKIGNVAVTNKSYIIWGGSKDWTYYHIANTVRTGMTRTTANKGVLWTNRTYTVDEHVHQFNNDENQTFYYYVCANNTEGQTCSPIRVDLMEMAGLSPTSPQVYSPISETYSGVIDINYTAALSPNNYEIDHYNVSLLYANQTFYKTIVNNNSLNLGYAWNSSGTPDSTYVVRVQACDVLSQCSYGYSSSFSTSQMGLTSCQNITSSGSYFLLNDVSATYTCFNVSANDVTIDCNGYSINFSTSVAWGAGVYSNKDNTVVRDCSMIRRGAVDGNGILFDHATNGTIMNNTIYNPSTEYGGINLNYASGNTIENNTVLGSGIALSNSDFNLFSSNILRTTNYYSMFVAYYSDNNTFQYNDIKNSAFDGRGYWIYDWSANNTIDGDVVWVNGSGTTYVIIISDEGTLHLEDGNTILGTKTICDGCYIDVGTVSNAVFYDDVFTYLSGSGGIQKVVNTTFTSLTAEDADVFWYVDFHTINSTGDDLGNVNVQTFDLNGNSLVNFTTESNGWLYKQLIPEYNVYGGAYINNYTPQSFNFSKYGYNRNSTSLTITENRVGIDSVPLQLELDTTPPLMTITSPKNASQFDDDLPLTIKVSCDDGIGSGVYSVYTNSSYFATPAYSAPYDLANSSNLVAGNYSIEVTCEDNSGYKNTSELYFTEYDYSPTSLHSCRNLSGDGMYYALGGDVVGDGTCFNILDDNIVLDCKDHVINFSNVESGSGVYSDRTNTTVENCLIDEGVILSDTTGIRFIGANNGLILNNTISNVYYFGIYMESSSGTIVQDNKLIGIPLTSSEGIYLPSSSTGNLLYNNSVSDFSICVDLESGSNDNVISGLNASGCSNALYLIVVSNNTFEDGILSENQGGSVIYIDSIWNNVFKRNTLSGSVGISMSAYNIETQNNDFIDTTISSASQDVVFSYVAFPWAVPFAITNNTFYNTTLASNGTWSSIASFYVSDNASISLTTYGISPAVDPLGTSNISKYFNITNQTNGGICGGTALTCDELDNMGESVCNSQYGCSWAGEPDNCSGYHYDCNSGIYTDKPTCDAELNCGWVSYDNAPWVFMNVSYSDADVPEGYSADNVTIWKDDGLGWVSIAESGTNHAENYSYANLTSFSNFGLFAGPAGGGAVDCGEISSSGVYTLTQDVFSENTCFNVTAENVTINCDGFIVNYSYSGSGYGVYSEKYNTSIMNCNFISSDASSDETSIYLIGSSDSVIYNNTDNNNYGAFFFSDLNRLNVTGNTISGVIANSYVGCVQLSQNVNDSWFENNTISCSGRSDFAIQGDSSNNMFVKNYVHDSGFSGFEIHNSYNNTYYQNDVADNSIADFYLSESAIGNNFTENSMTVSTVGFSVIDSSNYNIFDGNTFVGNKAFDVSTTNNIFMNNIIVTNPDSTHSLILEETGDNNLIHDNNITVHGYNSAGIQFATGGGSAENNSVFDNAILADGSDGIGIDTDAGVNNNIYNNTIIVSGNNGRGFLLWGSSFENITNNSILVLSESNGKGIHVVSSSLSNNIIGNNISVSEYSSSYAAYVDIGCDGNLFVSNTLNGSFDTLAFNTTFSNNTVYSVWNAVYCDDYCDYSIFDYNNITAESVGGTGSNALFAWAYGVEIVGNNLTTIGDYSVSGISAGISPGLGYGGNLIRDNVINVYTNSTAGIKFSVDTDAGVDQDLIENNIINLYTDYNEGAFYPATYGIESDGIITAATNIVFRNNVINKFSAGARDLMVCGNADASSGILFENTYFNSTDYPANASFTFNVNTVESTQCVLMNPIELPDVDPSGYVNLTKYLNVTVYNFSWPSFTETDLLDGWVFLNLTFGDAIVPAGYNSSNIKMLQFDGTWNEIAGSGTDYINNYTYANITSFSDFGVFAVQGGGAEVIDVVLNSSAVDFTGLLPGSNYSSTTFPLQLTIVNDTNVAVNVSLNASGNYVSGGDNFEIGNLTYSNSTSDCLTEMTTSFRSGYCDVFNYYDNWVNVPDSISDQYIPIYFWIQVPSGQVVGTYTTKLYVRVEKA